MLFIKSLTALAILALSQAAPVPLAQPQAKNVFNYDVINVDGSNLKPTSSLVELEKRATVTETIGYTSTSTAIAKGQKRTVWVTAGDEPVTAAPETATTMAPIQNKDDSGDLTVISGTTYRAFKVVSTIRPATTITYTSTYTSSYTRTVNGVVQTGVETIVSSSTEAIAPSTSVAPVSVVQTPQPTPSELPTTPAAAPTTSTSTSSPIASTSSIPSPSSSSGPGPSPSPSFVLSSSTSTQTATSTTSFSSSSSIITAAPETPSSSESGTPYTTITNNGVCEIYYDDGDDELMYVSGNDALSASSTTTITNIVYVTVSLN